MISYQVKVYWNVVIVFIVHDVELVLSDDIQSCQHIKCIIHSALYIFENDNLTLVTKLLVHLEYLVCDLRASDHGALTDFFEHRPRQEHQFLVLLVLVVILFVF